MRIEFRDYDGRQKTGTVKSTHFDHKGKLVYVCTVLGHAEPLEVHADDVIREIEDAKF